MEAFKAFQKTMQFSINPLIRIILSLYIIKIMISIITAIHNQLEMNEIFWENLKSTRITHLS